MTIGAQGNGFFLTLSDCTFSEETLREDALPDHLAAVPQFHACWSFCQAWLSGQDTFELQTSGSTGMPKRITYRRSQIEASARAAGTFLEYRAGQQSLLCLNAAFVGGIMVLARAMEWGMGVTVLQPSSQTIADLSADHSYDHISVSPIQLQATLSTPEGKARLERFRTVLIGGADLDPALRTAAAAIEAPRLYQTFGMTETLSHFALRRLNADHPDPAYQILPGVRLSTSEDQELIVDWPGIIEGPIQTHDRVNLIAPDRFVWLGRTDFTINSGGIKIQPEPVEAVAKDIWARLFGNAPEMVMVGLVDARLGQRAVLVAEAEPLPPVLHEALLEALLPALPKYHTPKQLVFLDVFPRTPTGKPNRRAIADVLKAQVGLDPIDPGT